MEQGLTARPYFPWIGGKERLIPIICPIFPPGFPRYGEHFGGSGSILLGRPKSRGRVEVYNDYDRDLSNLFVCVRDMVEDFVGIQCQIKELFSQVLDIDKKDGSVPEKMTAYVKTESAFQFCPQTIRYELWNNAAFAEVLYPKTMYELISYHFQECVKRELRFRICKNCGRYFPITGRSTAIYCHRPFGKGGGTCNGVGPVYAWTQKRKSDKVFMEYRREYKRRFAWIKSGRISKDEFYAWSKLALEKKKECDAGTLPCKSFFAWLRQS